MLISMFLTHCLVKTMFLVNESILESICGLPFDHVKTDFAIWEDCIRRK